jgi:dipeptidyl aminopeptidase/acylaminoacyl peptidase
MLTLRKVLSLAVAVLVAGAAGAAPAAPTARRPLAADDFFRVQLISEPQVSPEGDWVAYVVTVNDRDADEQRSALWMTSWDGTQHVQLTSPAKGAHAPRWSPDGRYLAFLATPAGADGIQLMLLDRRGGEPRTVTSVTGEVSDYAWSPDGKRLVLVVAPDGEEPVQGKDAESAASARDAATEKPPKPIVIDAEHFKADEEGYFTAGHEQHLYLVDVESRQLTPLTSDAGLNDTSPSWSPDGRRIAYVSTRERGADMDGRCDLRVVDARTGARSTTLLHPYVPNKQQLTWSPDGTQVAFLEGQEPRFNAYMQDVLTLVPANGGQSRAITASLDRSVFSYAFVGDGGSIAISVEDDQSVYAAFVDLRSGKIARLDTGKGVITDLSSGHGHTAALASADTQPEEVYALEGAQLRRLTHHNDALMAELQIGAVEELSFRSRDGTEVHGLLVKPPGYVAGRRYPTIVWIHGGPNGQDQHTLGFDEYQFRRQQLAASGFVVFGVNYRGSTGRGSAYARAIFADWGHLEVEDVLAGVDAVVASGIADPARLGIGGWSYGGILTDFTIAHDTRFKAAMSGAGAGNQLTMYGSDQYVLQYNAELGPPWENTDLWLKVSYPFLHAKQIRTPTLFMGGDRDFNVPIAGGEQMYQALRTLGVPTRLVIYPGQFHSLTRPSFLKDRVDRVTEWFTRYLGTAR